MFKGKFLRLKKAIYSFREEIATDPRTRPYMGDAFLCPVCGTGVKYFDVVDNAFLEELDRYIFNYSLFHCETFNMVHYSCPHCYAKDRDRLYALYFNKRTVGVDKNGKLNFIDFAPAAGLSPFLRAIPFLNYRSADLYMDGVDDRVDLRDMKLYADNSIDIFCCSHVLEHIEEDTVAMKELHRILKPGGWGIAMVPILTSSDHIIENLPITTEAERWRYYGQGDHVRFYNRSGFVNRLEDAGFKVKLFDINYFGVEEFRKHGVHPRSVLYIVEK